ncbi:MAG: mannose-1-phosphate guanylyltransferase/mannose-6-phosphate isomerase [Gammaproteobacteria bacterium]
MTISPVILAGGGGTRLWPLSREHYPKQLLKIMGEYTLLQHTLLRLKDFPGNAVGDEVERVPVDLPIIVCNEVHRFLVAEQVEELGIRATKIVLEPAVRNTAPALTVAALTLREGATDPTLLVMPADHVIGSVSTFQRAVSMGYQYAQKGFVNTFGIVPTAPDTGFGYIRLGKPIGLEQGSSGPLVKELDAFVEKPDVATARFYLDTGNYVWNSGIFMLKASVWLKAIGKHRPEILQACEQACASGAVDGRFFRAGKEAFEACPSDSIDYAVMERIAGKGGVRASVIALDAGWSDLGSWSSLWNVAERDGSGNVIKGDVCSIDSRDNVLISEHRFVAALGCDNLVVVETADAVLVAPKDRAEDVKRVVEWLKTKGREERLMHRCVWRPWGFYEAVDAGDRFQVKRITVNPGHSLSLQMHHHRAEHWVVVKGTAKVTRGEEQFLLSEDQSTYIPVGVTHRLENPGTIPLELVEVQSGSYLGEDDIVRLQDTYNRA